MDAERFNYEEVDVTGKRKAYEKKFDSQLQEWNAQISLLKAKADKAKAGAKIEYYKTIEALQHKRDLAKAKLQELKAAGDGAWEDLKTGAEKAWDEVKTAFHDAASKFKWAMPLGHWGKYNEALVDFAVDALGAMPDEFLQAWMEATLTAISRTGRNRSIQREFYHERISTYSCRRQNDPVMPKSYSVRGFTCPEIWRRTVCYSFHT
jgi:predicted ATP-binding protein involved in virulence